MLVVECFYRKHVCRQQLWMDIQQTLQECQLPLRGVLLDLRGLAAASVCRVDMGKIIHIDGYYCNFCCYSYCCCCYDGC